MPDEKKTYGDSLFLDFRIWWRHVRTLYQARINSRSHFRPVL